MPSILLPQVRVPSTPSMLLSIYFELCQVEKTKINKKRPGLAPGQLSGSALDSGHRNAVPWAMNLCLGDDN